MNRAGRALGAGALVLGAAALGAACGGDDDGPGLSGGPEGLTGDAAVGAELAEGEGCASCHSADGSERTGPTWRGIWGTEVALAGGGTAVVDRDYVARSIREPRADVVDGYSPIMPEPSLDDDEVDALVAYIEALGDDAPPAGGATTATTGGG